MLARRPGLRNGRSHDRSTIAAASATPAAHSQMLATNNYSPYIDDAIGLYWMGAAYLGVSCSVYGYREDVRFTG